jgi:hypothetical protein
MRKHWHLKSCAMLTSLCKQLKAVWCELQLSTLPLLEGSRCEPGLAQLSIILSHLEHSTQSTQVTRLLTEYGLLDRAACHDLLACMLMLPSNRQLQSALSLVVSMPSMCVAQPNPFAYLSVGHHIQAEEVVLKLCKACLVPRHLSTQLINLHRHQGAKAVDPGSPKNSMAISTQAQQPAFPASLKHTMLNCHFWDGTPVPV